MKNGSEIATRLAGRGAFTVEGQLAGGHRHAAYRVRDRAGARFVAKATRRGEAALRWAQALQHAALRAGLHLAPLIAAPDGRLAPGGLTLEPFIEGRPSADADLARLRPALRRLCNATCDWPQRPGFASAADPLTETRGGDIDLAAMPADLVQLCRAAWSPLAHRRQTPIHGDLNPSNLIIDRQGHPVLLDWDECRRDSPLFDLAAITPARAGAAMARAHLAWEVAAGWRVEPGHARTLAVRLRNDRGSSATSPC